MKIKRNLYVHWIIYLTLNGCKINKFYKFIYFIKPAKYNWYLLYISNRYLYAQGLCIRTIHKSVWRTQCVPRWRWSHRPQPDSRWVLFYSFFILFRESFKETQKKVGCVVFLQIKSSWKRFYVACDSLVKDCTDIVTYTIIMPYSIIRVFCNIYIVQIQFTKERWLFLFIENL